MTAHAKLDAAIRRLPLVAILRGLTPADAPSIGAALDGAGFSLIEVPLNSPQPLASIATLVAQLPNALIGAGTVLTTAQVREVHGAGGQLIVAPNFNADVVRLAVQLGMVCLPGVMTPTEAFAALAAGASGIKLFPAELVPPAGVKALRAVLSADTLVLPVGGITPEAMAAYRAAGANGFGLGSALYKPGDDAAAVAAAARRYVAAWST
jgi:2-dehydro-3-deoxyphosphogalactonate aldolase